MNPQRPLRMLTKRFLVLFCSALAAQAPAQNARFADKNRALLNTYCANCHNINRAKGQFRVDDLPFEIATVQAADRWQKLLNALNAGDMPPKGEAQPGKAEKTEFLDELSQALAAARRHLSDQDGKITMRRLNRREYVNTIRDLLGVDVDARDLPSDGGTGSFDTVGAALFMSGDQIEQYLALGRRALDVALPDAPPEKRIERREAEILANRVVRGTLGGYFLGGYKAAKQWQAAKGTKSPKEFGLPDEEEAKFRIRQYEEHGPTFAAYLANPYSETGSLLTIFNVHPQEVIALPPDTPSDWDKTKREPVPPGKYILRLRVGQLPNTPKERAFLEMGTKLGDGGFGAQKVFQITGTVAQPQIIEMPVTVRADGPRSFIFREKRPLNADFDLYYEVQRVRGVGPDPVIWVDWVEWEGPLQADNSATACYFQGVTGGDAARAREILRRFAVRAFRDKTPGDSFLQKLGAIYDARRAAGSSFNDALKEAMSVVLAAPGFLYLSEPAPEKVSPRRALSSLELAVRLSYFLWSAPPDDELLNLARNGQLQRPEVLEKQVNRLLDDPKAQAFVTGFSNQWLGLERLDFFQFNTKKYRDFDESTRLAAKREVFETFAHLLRRNESLRSLLKSDFVVVNGLLANYYGLPGVSGDEFRRVALPPNSPRGGLLGMAAILGMGSNGDSTSPVERGAWVLRKLLHDPPPPAPPNVPQLSRLDGKVLPVRERLLAHQEEPQCASCHRKIDPIGFGLENFDAAGKWRTEDSYEYKGARKSWPVDAAAAFHDGPAFKDYFELRDLIASRHADFARGFSEKLIEYGLGRPYAFSDEPLAQALTQRAAAKDYATREFILALVQSDKFKSK